MNLQTNQPPEEELLCCAGRPANAETAARIERILERPLDAGRLLELARRHAVEPLLHRRLGALAPAAAPREILEPLRRRAREIALWNLSLAGELLRIEERFRQADLPLIPYKGPLLAVAAHGDLALRRFLDLDLLVRREDFSRARELLRAMGYRRSLVGPHEAAYVASLAQLPLTRDDGQCLVELHAELGMPGFRHEAAFDELWDRREAVTLGGRPVATLKAEDLLLYLCVHGAKHCWSRLAWICDVAALLCARPNLDWDRLAREAGRLHCRRMLELGLYLPCAIFDARAPCELQRAAPVVPALAESVQRNLFRSSPPGGASRAWFHVRTRERWRDRFECLGSLLLNPTPADWSASRLPSRWRLVHAALRPMRLMRKRLTGQRRGRG